MKVWTYRVRDRQRGAAHVNEERSFHFQFGDFLSGKHPEAPLEFDVLICTLVF